MLSGTADLVVAGGVQNMSAIPIASAMMVGPQFGFETPFAGSVGWAKRYGDQEVSQFRAADLIAEKWDISREADGGVRAASSHQRALAAIAEGRFDREIVAVRRDDHRRGAARRHQPGEDGRPASRCARAAGSRPRCRRRSPTRRAPCWSRRQAPSRSSGSRPRARVHHISVRGDDPVYMLTAPIRATRVRARARPG